MIEFFLELATLEKVFAIMAVVASLLFVIQLLIMLVTGGGEADVDAHVDIDASGIDADIDMDVDTDLDGADGHVAHADSDIAFKVFTVQGTVAFFMMLGWIGLATSKASGFGPAASIGIGVAAGIVANLVIAKLFQSFKKLQTSGTMNLKNAVGEEGEVYLTIKENEPGKVRVAVQEHLKVFDAVSDEGGEIPTGTRVIVVRVVKGNTMVVKRI
jgi:membrane protein implicated in regulation of membrane protease activity